MSNKAEAFNFFQIFSLLQLAPVTFCPTLPYSGKNSIKSRDFGFSFYKISLSDILEASCNITDVMVIWKLLLLILITLADTLHKNN